MMLHMMTMTMVLVADESEVEVYRHLSEDDPKKNRRQMIEDRR